MIGLTRKSDFQKFLFFTSNCHKNSNIEKIALKSSDILKLWKTMIFVAFWNKLRLFEMAQKNAANWMWITVPPIQCTL